MSNKVKIPLGDKEIEGELVDINETKELWNEYELSDGSKIRLKVVVSRIVRTDQYNDAGEPIYVVNSTNIVDAIVPPELKAKEKKPDEPVQ